VPDNRSVLFCIHTSG